METKENFPYHLFKREDEISLRADHGWMKTGTWYVHFEHKSDVVTEAQHVIIIPVTGTWSVDEALYYARMSLAAKCDVGHYIGEVADYVAVNVAWEREV